MDSVADGDAPVGVSLSLRVSDTVSEADSVGIRVPVSVSISEYESVGDAENVCVCDSV